jgi:uncharacterized membrane protein
MALLLLVLGMVVLALPPGPRRHARMRLGLAVVLGFTGTDHLVNPWRYWPIMPAAVPFPRAVVLATGLCEMLGGLGLLLPRTRRLAGTLLAVFFVGVLPANIKAAAQGIVIVGLEAPAWAYWARIPAQALVVWWALHAAGIIRPRAGRACQALPPASAASAPNRLS